MVSSRLSQCGLTSERDSPFGIDSTYMNKDQDKKSEIRIPDDGADVIEIAGAKTDKEKSLAVAQARLIGDL